MSLSLDVLQRVVDTGHLIFDVDRHTPDRADSSVMAGDGLDDINQVLATLAKYPRATVTLDTSLAYQTSAARLQERDEWVAVTRGDVEQIKLRFIATYGSVSRAGNLEPA